MPSTPHPVVLTRSSENNAPLAATLRARQLAVVEWTALRTIPLSLPGDETRARLRATDVVAFTSRRAVSELARAVGPLRGVLPPRVVAVGPGTASELEALDVASRALGGEGGLAMARQLAAELPAGTKLVLVRSASADPAVASLLRDAGLVVDDLHPHDVEAAGMPALEPRPLGCVICASPSAARAFLASHPWARRAPFVAIGATTADELRRLGAPGVEVAARPDDDALADAAVGIVARAGASR